MNSLVDFMAVLGVIGGTLALAAAVFIFRTAPDRRVGVRFGLLLVLEATMLWTSRSGPLHWIEPSGLPSFWLRIHIANDGLLIASYLPALAVTISSKLLDPFRSNRVAISFLGIGLVNAVCVFAFPAFYLKTGDFIFRPGEGLDVIGPGWVTIAALLTLSYVFGLVATLLVRQSARGPLAKRKATMLALAFGSRDLTWGFIYSLLVLGVFIGPMESLRQYQPVVWVMASGLTTYVCLMVYGIVSAHLFDIDLKIKWTLERGTIAAIFIAVFFMVSEGASAFLSEQLGSLVGIIATGGLVFALAPLQRVAEKLANQAMPTVQDTPEYRSYRKLQVYGEAVAEAMSKGPISPVARVVLNRLRAQLELDGAEAEALEREFGHAGISAGQV
jgi:hypothetical protein